MKKLLCVLLFGMVFGQALIETREIEVFYDEENVGEEGEVYYNLYEMFNLTGDVYHIKVVDITSINCPQIQDGYIQLVGYGAIYYNYDILDNMLIPSVTVYPPDWYTTHYDYIMLNNTSADEAGINGEVLIRSDISSNDDCSYKLKLWVTGQFSDTDVGLQGDLNDDNGVDILDIIFLVNIILDDGTGDINGLIDAVTG